MFSREETEDHEDRRCEALFTPFLAFHFAGGRLLPLVADVNISPLGEGLRPHPTAGADAPIELSGHEPSFASEELV